MSFRMQTQLTSVSLALAAAFGTLALGAQTIGEAPVITGISVCGAGVTPSDSCPDGTFDTQQVVLADTGVQLNAWNLANAVDEHSSVFPPRSLGDNRDYLFFVASGTNPRSASPNGVLVHEPEDIGVVVLSGRLGGDGAWRMTFAPGYGSRDDDGNVGQTFMAPAGQGDCPASMFNDATFDLKYAAPGSVVADPTQPPGNLLMYYEGTNGCQNLAGVDIFGSIATSDDYGKHWPLYAGTERFTFAPLPYQNVTQGPGLLAGAGGFGSTICIDDHHNCTPHNPYPGYGRYPVLSPPAGPEIRDAQIAAFVDDVGPDPQVYLYTVQEYNPAEALPDGRAYDITIARAKLNGGAAPLAFEKWNGEACDASPCWAPRPSGQLINDLPEYQIVPDGDFTDCGDRSQERTSPSISYLEQTRQYVLTFVCRSNGDPKLGSGQQNPQEGAAWFFATSSDLSNPNEWKRRENRPREIKGSWNTFTDSNRVFYNGWYPTFMSMRNQPGRLSTTGYAFYLWGCEGGQCGGRQFTSRRFAIRTSDDAYSRPPVAAIDGPATETTHDPVKSFSFRSNEPDSAFRCSFDGSAFSACASQNTFLLKAGTNELRVKAINPFGEEGPAARVSVTYVPFVIGGGGTR